jgi:hypothetical protein
VRLLNLLGAAKANSKAPYDPRTWDPWTRGPTNGPRDEGPRDEIGRGNVQSFNVAANLALPSPWLASDCNPRRSLLVCESGVPAFGATATLGLRSQRTRFFRCVGELLLSSPPFLALMHCEPHSEQI